MYPRALLGVTEEIQFDGDVIGVVDKNLEQVHIRNFTFAVGETRILESSP